MCERKNTPTKSNKTHASSPSFASRANGLSKRTKDNVAKKKNHEYKDTKTKTINSKWGTRGQDRLPATGFRHRVLRIKRGLSAKTKRLPSRRGGLATRPARSMGALQTLWGCLDFSVVSPSQRGAREQAKAKTKKLTGLGTISKQLRLRCRRADW